MLIHPLVFKQTVIENAVKYELCGSDLYYKIKKAYKIFYDDKTIRVVICMWEAPKYNVDKYIEGFKKMFSTETVYLDHGYECKCSVCTDVGGKLSYMDIVIENYDLTELNKITRECMF